MPMDFAFARAAPDPVRPGLVVGVDELGSDGCTRRLDMSTGPDVRADPERPPTPDTPVVLPRTRWRPTRPFYVRVRSIKCAALAAACCSRGSPGGVHTRTCLSWLTVCSLRVNCGLRSYL